MSLSERIMRVNFYGKCHVRGALMAPLLFLGGCMALRTAELQFISRSLASGAGWRKIIYFCCCKNVDLWKDL